VVDGLTVGFGVGVGVAGGCEAVGVGVCVGLGVGVAETQFYVTFDGAVIAKVTTDVVQMLERFQCQSNPNKGILSLEGK
jgi:hypothetical protein